MQPCNLLVLDEPTNHLDIISKERLKMAVHAYNGAAIIVSHDRTFLKGLTQKVYEFENGYIKEYLGDIDYFLEKKAIESMRIFEQSDPKTPKISQHQTKIIDKRQEREIQAIEKKISNLEQEMTTLQRKLADPEIYSTSSFQQHTQKYQQLEKNLSDLYSQWELAHA